MNYFIFYKLYPPGQDEYLYIEPKLDCGFPLNCRKYNRYSLWLCSAYFLLLLLLFVMQFMNSLLCSIVQQLCSVNFVYNAGL